MDYMLDIIIPKSEIEKSGLSEVLREWGGVMYSSTPAVYVTDSNIEFIEVTNLSYYSRLLDSKISDDLIALHLKSDILHDFECFANNQITQADENTLITFFKCLFGLSKFYILLIREDELIKGKYRISNVDELESILVNSVKWSSPADVLLYK